MLLAAAVPFLDLKLAAEEIRAGEAMLYEVTKNARKTIGLFTHATGNKRYPEAWWSELYHLLTVRFQHFNIVEILPIENISNLSRVAPVFYSSNIRELASFMANAAIVIAADSGVMHLASSSKTATVGLFSVTDPKIYAPYNANSIAIDTNTTSIPEIAAVVEDILLTSSGPRR